MGQQQLLLIVLGVIVVGIAVVVGLNLFNSNAVSSNRDSLESDLNSLGVMAQSYYKTPATMGGGGSTFTGWTIPAKTDTTPNGTYAATVTAQNVTIVGTGHEQNAGTAIKHTATVTINSITIVKNN
jgi:hypothetical protein